MRALISVYDKNGLDEFCKTLDSLGYEIYSTGGTLDYIKKIGINAFSISDITNHEEILEGRVKTLHPRIHAGILADPDNPIHNSDIRRLNLQLFDIVVNNLYPFEKVSEDPKSSHEEIIENIDIGGPSMLRAAAKNFKRMIVLYDPEDYSDISQKLISNSVDLETREKLAKKIFKITSDYDKKIFDFLSKNEEQSIMPSNLDINLSKIADLRYGENPHQNAGLYVSHKQSDSLTNAKIHQGKELSYNNFLDANTAMNCVMEFDDPACVIVKHVNPCGVAIGRDIENAYEKSFETDPESAFGGVIAVNDSVDETFASALIENQFVEVLIAPDFSEDALNVLKEKKNIRVISKKNFKKIPMPFSIQAIDGGFLVQEDDWKIIDKDNLEYVTERRPTDHQIIDLLFAWKVCKYVKSNAIIFAKNQQTIGIGAGQMSRVNSAKIASLKAATANLDTKDSVMASDGFFPFSDSIKMASDNGISCIIQPGGSIKDNEVIEEANKQNIAMVMTRMRHFRH